MGENLDHPGVFYALIWEKKLLKQLSYAQFNEWWCGKNQMAKSCPSVRSAPFWLLYSPGEFYMSGAVASQIGTSYIKGKMI